MRRLASELAVVRQFQTIWKGLVAPAWIGDARERHLSRALNVILLILLVWGLIVEIQAIRNHGFSGPTNTIRLLVLGALALAYFLDRRGEFAAAIMLTLAVFLI